MKAVIVALALLGSAAALTEREALAATVNAAKTTWTAFVGSDAHKPLHSSRHLYGVKAGSRVEFDRLARQAGSGFVMAPKVSAAAAAAIPDSFSSAEAWPACAQVINDIRDQSNCGCCWAFAAASAASDRACIASNGTIATAFSAEDVCFNAESNGCGGGSLHTPWAFIKRTGVVTGGQNVNDSAVASGLPPSDPFWQQGLCAPFTLPHCHHLGDQGSDPYPAEGEPGCESQRSPAGPSDCDAGSSPRDFATDKYSFEGLVTGYPKDVASIQSAIMTDGPVEAAFSVYADFETYSGGIYQHVAGDYEGGHAIRIVGWGSENGTDYWKVANSWNPYWGEAGYFRILRGANECGIEAEVTASSSGALWANVAA